MEFGTSTPFMEFGTSTPFIEFGTSTSFIDAGVRIWHKFSTRTVVQRTGECVLRSAPLPPRCFLKTTQTTRQTFVPQMGFEPLVLAEYHER
jgi:hypothetical protein